LIGKKQDPLYSDESLLQFDSGGSTLSDIAQQYGYEEQPNEKEKRTLLMARVSSFSNGASFACHISLLPVQVTSLANMDMYEYTTIVSSLGGISTVLILLSFKWIAAKDTDFSISVAYLGHLVGTAILCIPQLYSLPNGAAASIIVISYGVVLLSFFIMNLSCEVSLGQKSLNQKNGKDAAAGVQMGLIKSLLSIGKVCGAALVVFTFRIHPQMPLWILEGLLVVGALLTAILRKEQQRKRMQRRVSQWASSRVPRLSTILTAKEILELEMIYEEESSQSSNDLSGGKEEDEEGDRVGSLWTVG